MALTFFPKAGTALVCDFRGYEPPEIVSIRPVIVISPNHLAILYLTYPYWGRRLIFKVGDSHEHLGSFGPPIPR
jgi:uncharacterized protein YifN (PemK superfamily)